MPNGDSPRIVVTFDQSGAMQMQTTGVSPAQLALAALFIQMQAQAALQPKPGEQRPGILVPQLKFPPPRPGV